MIFMELIAVLGNIYRDENGKCERIFIAMWCIDLCFQ